MKNKPIFGDSEEISWIDSEEIDKIIKPIKYGIKRK